MSRPRGSGYEALPAHDELEEELEDGTLQDNDLPSAIQPPQHQSRTNSGSAGRRDRSRSLSASVLSIDATALDAKLSQWRKAIKKKFAKKQCELESRFSCSRQSCAGLPQ